MGLENPAFLFQDRSQLCPKKIDVPVLIMHGDDDQIVPIADSALPSAKLLRNGTLKVYKGLPHGMCTTHPDLINNDFLAFIHS